MTDPFDKQIASSETERSRLWRSILAAGLLAGLSLRIYLLRVIHTPGQWDAAFYYTVAKNIVLGRGLVVDYVWHFVNGPSPLTHYSSDFWHPLTSYVMAVPMRLFGISVSSALIASIAAGMGVTFVAIALGKIHGPPEDARVMSVILSFFAPYAIQTSLATDSVIYFSLAGMLTLYFTIKARRSPQYFLLAAVFSGLGHLTRQDGILLIGTILVCLFIAPESGRNKLLLAAGTIGIHLLVLSPLMVKNYRELHSLFPPGPPMTRFLTEHDDVYAFGETFTFRTYWKEFGLQGILQNKLQTAYFHALQANSVLDPVVVVLLGISLADLAFIRRDKQRLLFFLPAVVYTSLTYFFYVFVASFALFSAQKSLVALMSFIAILVMDFASRRIRYKPFLMGLWFGLTLYLGAQGYFRTLSSNATFEAAYDRMRATQPAIGRDAAQRDLGPGEIIVMTHDPWHYYEATGWPTVMIPNNDLETILRVADLYHATYLLLPAPREALRGIYAGIESHPRLDPLDPPGEIRIFRILPGP